MVEGARLESVYTSKGYREFESLTLRNRRMISQTHWVARFRATQFALITARYI